MRLVGVYLQANMKKLAVLISDGGTGTNLQAVIDGVESKAINAQLIIVISDTEKALGLGRAKKHHIPYYILQPQDILEQILKNTYRVDFVILAGWKKFISKKMIELFANRIFNLHPGLIPETVDGVVKNPDQTRGLWNRGKFTEAAVRKFLETKATYAGSSIHFLTQEFDFGPVLARCFEKIQPNDTVETLYRRLKVKENALYVDVLSKLCNKQD